MAYIFPVHLFNPAAVNARPVAQVISGGTSLSGIEETIATDGGGRWVVEYSGIELRTPQQQRVWSAWAGYLAGGVVECLVPLLSLATAPRPMAWDGPRRVSTLVVDDPVFPTSVQYAAPLIAASLADDADVRATTLAIDLTSAGEILGGEKLSIGEYAYKIVRKTGANTFNVTPPLREAVSEDDAVEFNWPLVKCRAAPGQDLETPITRGRFSTVSIVFLESVPVSEPD